MDATIIINAHLFADHCVQLMIKITPQRYYA